MGAASPRASCWIVAGPNGAGKTIFALEYLPNVAECRRFVSADLIASGLSPLAPEKERVAAARIFLSESSATSGRVRISALRLPLQGGAI